MFNENAWKLTNLVALVTGGTSGIGLSIAEELLGLGARVIVVGRDQQKIEQTLSALGTRFEYISAIQADVSVIDDCRKIAEKVGKETGALDILINNVGTNIRKPTSDYSHEEIMKIFNTNLFSTFELSRALLPSLKKAKDSCVVNILSVAGLIHLKTGAPYGMTKAALVQLTKNLAVEWAEFNIRVNSIAPWYTKTPLVKTILDNPETLSAILARTPMRRVAEADEVARAATFFCLPAASYVTGQTLAVDGGFSVNGY